MVVCREDHDAGASSSNLAFFSEGEADGSSSALRLEPPLVTAEVTVGSPCVWFSATGFFFFFTIDVKSLTCVVVATAAAAGAAGAPALSSLSRAFAAMAGADSPCSFGSVLSSST